MVGMTEWEAKEIEAEMKARWQIRFDVDTDIPLRYICFNENYAQTH